MESGISARPTDYPQGYYNTGNPVLLLWFLLTNNLFGQILIEAPLMERRLSKEDKGKGVASVPTQPPRTGRIKASVPIENARSHRLSLTLIGRVTNRTIQKVWSLIPFFTELWKDDGRPVGSDLGNGLFQFQFENEADLNAVLERRPYHYARWMVILQRWEPTTAATFPSLIPFWIKVQGIPIHLWDEGTVKSLAEDFGVFERAEITDFAVRMRVQVNGLLPLVKSSVIEYPNGDEVTASFVYERLERHCSKCFRLDHDIKDCLVAKHQARELKQQELSTNLSVMDNHKKDSRDHLSENSEAYRFSASKDLDCREVLSHRHDAYRHEARRRETAENRNRTEQESSLRRGFKEQPRGLQDRLNRTFKSHQHDPPRNRLIREDARHRLSSRNRNDHLQASRVRTRDRREDSGSSKLVSDQIDRGTPLKAHPLPQEISINEALGNVREAMLQLTHGVVPPVSGTRKDRLRPTEEVAQTTIPAEGLIGPSRGFSANSQPRYKHQTELGENDLMCDPVEKGSSSGRRLPATRRLSIQTDRDKDSTERMPASQRLGVPSLENNPEERRPATQRLGPSEVAMQPTERLPASLRLGQQGTDEADAQTLNLAPPKRKPGRPPSKRETQQPEQNLIKGSTSKKRKTKGAKPSPVRRTLVSESPKGIPKPLSGTSRASRKTSKSTATPTASENQPICNMIPASSKRRVDFHNPSFLGP